MDETRPSGYSDLGSVSMPSSAASEDAVELTEQDLSLDRLQDGVCAVLEGLGEDLAREGLRDTPKRVAKAWLDATEGYSQSVHGVLGGALFHESFSSRRDNSVVLIQDVDFASTSEHSLLPFFGRCHIAYVPRNGVVLGLSKVARLAKLFARRLQNQQRFTHQILEAFNAEVQPLGCAALVEARHLGDRADELHVTSSSLGCFYAQPEIFMQEFAAMLGRSEFAPPEPSFQQRESTSRQCSPATCNCNGRQSSSSLALSSNATEHMTTAVESMLREIGEDPTRQGLQGSARRYVDHLLNSTAGSEPSSSVESRSGPVQSSTTQARDGIGTFDCYEMQFTSQCEHHLLPFQGSVKMLCLPGSSGKRLDEQLAKSVVQVFSKRLQIQERLTHQMAAALQNDLQASGVLILCRAAHMCMVARGVEQHASTTCTMAAYGVLETDASLRAKCLQVLKNIAAPK